MILASVLRRVRAVLAHPSRRLPASRLVSECRRASARIGSSNDVPVACGHVMRGKAEHGFERDMPVKAAIVAEDEFVEIRINMLAPQAVICTQAPPFQQRKEPANPWQHNMARHFADRARIVAIAG